MNLVRSLLPAERTAPVPGEANKAEPDSCVRQNRVVLAVVATVKPCGDGSGLNRVSAIANSQGDGDKKELVAGESAA